MSNNDPILTSTYFSQTTDFDNVTLGESETLSVTTDGYYAANDGGGATFTVRNKETGETADGYFLLSIAGNPALIAALHIPNGVVILDQLGYIGLEADPTLDFENVDTENFNTWYNTTFLPVNPMEDGSGAEVFAAALENDAVREIRFRSGKWYPLSNTVYVETSDKVINGNGAMVISDHNYSSPLFFLEDGASNITFRNLRLSIVMAPMDSPCIAASGTENIRLENVTFLMSSMGIDADQCTNLTLHNVQAMNCIKLLLANSVKNVVMENVSFSHPFRSNANNYSRLTDAVLSFSGDCEHVTLRDIRITEALCKTAVSVVGTQADRATDFTITNMWANSVSNVFYFKYAENVSALHVHTAQIDCAVTMESVKNLKVADGKFESRTASSAPILQPASGVCDDAWFVHCLFIADSWFNVQNRTVTGDSMKFLFCAFRTWDLTDCTLPAAYFGNSVSDMLFADCRFDGRGLSDTSQSNACLFSLYSDTDTDSCFTFTRCAMESPNENVNSPLRISLHGGEDVHVQLTDSTLYGFRWTTRVTADDNESTTGEIDPAETGFASETDAQTAAAALTALGRFFSEDNIYLYHTLPDGQTEYCRRAETYGVTN